MVDSISNGPVTSLLRTQQSAAVSNLKSSQDAVQALVTQLQKTAVPAKPAGVPQPTKIFSPSSNLPRGSIVDKLV
ncbi:MAG: hypothetical protein SFW62_03515 [Alphaproteobacteria bacterium]|nr:hypothetical protein [Alphaproteobacteria bacterium]